MPRHSAVQALLEDLVERDGERGLQATAYLDGQLVLETWSGLAGQPMETRCGKSVVATGIHLLAERGRKRCHQLRTVVCGTSSCSATERRPRSVVTFRLTADPDDSHHVKTTCHQQVRQQGMRASADPTAPAPNPDPFDQQRCA